MAVTNRIPEVKAALVDGLNARPALAGKVTWGVPRDEGGGREWIVVGDVEGPQRPVTIRRPPARVQQELTILVVVNVAATNDVVTPRELADRAFVLVDEVETFVRETPTLGLPDVIDAVVTRTDLKEPPGDGAQRSCRVDVYVFCRARS